MFRLLNEMKAAIAEKNRDVTGFNVGINNGASAGQTIFHCHLHMIPRRIGDVAKPRGGLRNVIPGQADHRAGADLPNSHTPLLDLEISLLLRGQYPSNLHGEPLPCLTGWR